MMKKLHFFFLLLSFWGLGGISYAQSVKLIGANFVTSAVTFTVDVGAATPTWVLVEYTTDPSPTSAIMSRATFTNVTIIPSDAGAFSETGEEKRGIRLTKSATVTATLDGVAPGRFSWCAYVFDAPPRAKVKAEGGYSLHGTPPFIINGNIEVSAGTFGAGTCITSFTDFTYNPDGVVLNPPAVTAAAPAPVCAGAEVTFSATATGGTTTAMTYTWNIAGNTATTTSATYTTAIADAGEATYTVFVTNANGCTSTAAAGTISVVAEFNAGSIIPVHVVSPPGTNPNVTIANASSATGGDGSITYQWRRSGNSSATLTGSNATYALSTDTENYSTTGVHYFTRYAKDGVCNTAFTASNGQCTLTVADPETPPHSESRIWIFGAQTWSGTLRNPVSGCAAVATLSTAASPPAQYKDRDAAYGFYYNWTCVNAAKSELCPDLWRVPSQADVDALTSYCQQFGNTDIYWSANGRIAGNSVLYPAVSYYWTSTPYGTDRAWCYFLGSGLPCVISRNGYDESYRWSGENVRCVK